MVQKIIDQFSRFFVGALFIFSGLIIFVVACQQGFSVQESPHEVPQVTAKAVVQSIGAVVAFNLTLTILVYLKQLIRLGIL